MTWLSSLKGWLIAAGVAAIAILAALGRAWQAGRASAAADQQAKRLDAVKDKKDSDDEVAQMDGAAVDHELDRWMRDKPR